MQKGRRGCECCNHGCNCANDGYLYQINDTSSSLSAKVLVNFDDSVPPPSSSHKQMRRLLYSGFMNETKNYEWKVVYRSQALSRTSGKLKASSHTNKFYFYPKFTLISAADSTTILPTFHESRQVKNNSLLGRRIINEFLRIVPSKPVQFFYF